MKPAAPGAAFAENGQRILTLVQGHIQHTGRPIPVSVLRQMVISHGNLGSIEVDFVLPIDLLKHQLRLLALPLKGNGIFLTLFRASLYRPDDALSIAKIGMPLFHLCDLHEILPSPRLLLAWSLHRNREHNASLPQEPLTERAILHKIRKHLRLCADGVPIADTDRDTALNTKINQPIRVRHWYAVGILQLYCQDGHITVSGNFASVRLNPDDRWFCRRHADVPQDLFPALIPHSHQLAWFKCSGKAGTAIPLHPLLANFPLIQPKLHGIAVGIRHHSNQLPWRMIPVWHKVQHRLHRPPGFVVIVDILGEPA